MKDTALPVSCQRKLKSLIASHHIRSRVFSSAQIWTI